MKRIGLGKGRGSGYRNIIPRDPRVHSDAARGVKQPQWVTKVMLSPHVAIRGLTPTQKKELIERVKKKGLPASMSYREAELVAMGRGGKTAPKKPGGIPVIFRKFKDGEVIAIFPNAIADYSGHVQTYLHVGQHGAGNFPALMRDTKAATSLEYSALKKELSEIGYSGIKPVLKDTRPFQETRRRDMESMR